MIHSPKQGPAARTAQSLLIALVVLTAIAFTGCDYARMYDQDVVKTYGRKIPAMDKRTIPVRDGFQTLSRADAGGLKNPLPFSRESVERGKLAYQYYCVQCHGPGLDGNGAVGQSFAPFPSDLRSSAILSQTDGELYGKIRLGYGRHPVLFSTVPPGDAWAVILYARSPVKGGS